VILYIDMHNFIITNIGAYNGVDDWFRVYIRYKLSLLIYLSNF